MAAKLKDATRDAILTDVISQIGGTAVLVIYSGAVAGKTGGVFNADPTGELVEIALPSSPFGTPSATAPQSYRIKTATGGDASTVVVEGTAGVGSGDLSLATAITTGQVVSVSAFGMISRLAAPVSDEWA